MSMETLAVVARVLAIYAMVALIAGGIAYLGNDLGRKIGRKKMSVLGLRPRHTSNFITVMTGSVIAVTTLTLSAIFSQEVRVLLTGIDKLRAELVHLKDEVAEARAKLDRGRMVWGVGQPIMHGVLQPKVPATKQRNNIMGVLGVSNAISIKKNNDIAREKGEPKIDAFAQLVTWDESQLDKMVEHMMTEDKVVGVRIVAERNCLYRDNVPVSLELIPVSRIFKEGEVVATCALQPDSPELLLEWYNFLEQIRETALRRGMIEINDSLGGGLSGEDLERLIQELKRLHGPGKLVAVAKYDLYQTSSLAIRVEVRPQSTVGAR